jgi:hypothetical protein
MSTRDEHLSPTQFAPPTGFAPPSPEDRAAPLSILATKKIRVAQGLPARQFQEHPWVPTPTPPPSGWPTDGQVAEAVDQHGSTESAYEKTAAAVPKVKVTEKRMFKKPTETEETPYGMDAKSIASDSAFAKHSRGWREHGAKYDPYSH